MMVRISLLISLGEILFLGEVNTRFFIVHFIND